MATTLPDLFALGDIETKAVLRACNRAHQALGELKGVLSTLPSPEILLSTLALQEAKDSSEIEQIITTHDDLYQSNYSTQQFVSAAAKEVHRYAQATLHGYQVLQTQPFITARLIQDIQQILVNNDAGFRRQAGTQLKNPATGQCVYEPPQTHAEIEAYMAKLLEFVNIDAQEGKPHAYDPLVKMAIIHYQFESIHPFYDGNGRTGRILNVLYLVQQALLDTPILYLSRYINQNKTAYYTGFQQVRETGNWETWLLYMIKGIEHTARLTVQLVNAIEAHRQDVEATLLKHAPKLLMTGLMDNLFKYPYTKVPYLAQDCQVSEGTALRYLNQLIELGVLARMKIGRETFYVNKGLVGVLVG